MREFLNKLYVCLLDSHLGKILLKIFYVLHISNGIRRLVYFLEFLTGARRNSKRYFEEHKDNIQTVENLLADNLSLETYRAAIKFRSTSLRRDLLKVCRPASDQYFDRVAKVTNSEYFVDCGAFTGDTIENYLRITGGKYEHIYAFEPDPKNCVSLQEFIDSQSLKNIDILQFATGKDSCKVRFETGMTANSSSKIGGAVNDVAEVYKRDSIEVQVEPLDKVLAGKKVTFLKMDIEGAETDSLIGAEKLIIEQNPKLAICIYHSDSDMINIPLLIHKLVPEYKFYIRHYSDTWIETVLYAIP